MLTFVLFDRPPAADGVIACWNDKNSWSFWTPITAIREGDVDGQRGDGR